MMKANKILIVCRKIIGFSQTKMANKLGISLVAYNQKEVGKVEFNKSEMKTIENICREEGLDLTVEDIFFKKEVSIKVTA